MQAAAASPTPCAPAASRPCCAWRCPKPTAWDRPCWRADAPDLQTCNSARQRRTRYPGGAGKRSVPPRQRAQIDALLAAFRQVWCWMAWTTQPPPRHAGSARGQFRRERGHPGQPGGARPALLPGFPAARGAPPSLGLAAGLHEGTGAGRRASLHHFDDITRACAAAFPPWPVLLRQRPTTISATLGVKDPAPDPPLQRAHRHARSMSPCMNPNSRRTRNHHWPSPWKASTATSPAHCCPTSGRRAGTPTSPCTNSRQRSAATSRAAPPGCDCCNRAPVHGPQSHPRDHSSRRRAAGNWCRASEFSAADELSALSPGIAELVQPAFIELRAPTQAIWVSAMATVWKWTTSWRPGSAHQRQHGRRLCRLQRGPAGTEDLQPLRQVTLRRAEAGSGARRS